MPQVCVVEEEEEEKKVVEERLEERGRLTKYERPFYLLPASRRVPTGRARSCIVRAKAKYDYDVVIIGCGVGGHGAALHAVEKV